MQRPVHPVLLGCLTVLCFTAGSDMAQAATSTNPILAANNEIGLAATGTLMNYQEHFSPAQTHGKSDTESGWMPGFAVNYSLMGDYFRSLPNLYFDVHYDYASGGLHYQGFLQKPGLPNIQSTENATTQHVLARLGMGFTVGQRMLLTPYVAGGYQRWNRNLSATQEEVYHAELVGAGLRYQLAPMSRLVLSANLEGLAVVGGGMTPSGNLIADHLGNAPFGTSGEEKLAVDVDYRLSGLAYAFS
ncbi:hypothetical protein ACSDBR_07245 [Acidithiobacillus ferriphilus]|uniref:hypothetical protein n=1 Tax=Acidithiobacillus ferriphilus TaxID=1689834 RepID=UPI003F50EE7F